jgi:hypothetical protein
MSSFEYPYAVTSGILSFIAAGLLLLKKDQRRPLILSGLLSLPCSLTTFYFVPEYWQPVRLFGFTLGIEDTLFSFSTGTIAWFPAAMVYSPKLPDTALTSVLPRYLWIAVVATAVMLITRSLSLPVMLQAIIGISVMGLLLALRKPRSLPIALFTGICFALSYTLLLAALFILFPGFFTQWTHANLSGTLILGVPVEEIVWAFFFGSCWVIAMNNVFNVPAERDVKQAP